MARGTDLSKLWQIKYDEKRKQELHEQKLKHNEELHRERLKKAKHRPKKKKD